MHKAFMIANILEIFEDSARITLRTLNMKY